MKTTIKLLDERYLELLYGIKNDVEVLKNIPGEYPLNHASFIKQHKEIIKTGPSTDLAAYTIFVDNEIAGITGHFKREGKVDVEVGYFIGKDWWAKGVATSALVLHLQELQNLGFSGKVVAGHAVENIASGRVLQKAGFIRDGESEFILPDGTTVMDPHWMILL